MTTAPIHWGILGCGQIAAAFAKALALLPDAKLVAVASRDANRARAFAHQHGGARVHADYAALAKDAEVDVVYIATTSAQHAEHVRLCLEAGRHVLCEKPMTTSAADTAALIACARQQRRFLMEAMWTRFLPIYAEVRRWISEGRIGDVRGMRGDFCITSDPQAKPRLFDPRLGGGAMIDVGIYPLAMAFWLFGAPLDVKADLIYGATGVDEQGTLILRHAGQRQSTCVFGIRSEGSHDLHIYGSEGSIRVPGAWWAQEAQLVRGFTVVETAKPEWVGSGYAYEARAVMTCLREGTAESAVMPLAETLAIAECMDAILRRCARAHPSTLAQS